MAAIAAPTNSPTLQPDQPANLTTWLIPALGLVVAGSAVAAALLIIRFAGNPVDVAVVVIGVLLITLTTLGNVGARRGHAAVFVAIALILPYLLAGAAYLAATARLSAELSSIFE